MKSVWCVKFEDGCQYMVVASNIRAAISKAERLDKRHDPHGETGNVESVIRESRLDE